MNAAKLNAIIRKHSAPAHPALPERLAAREPIETVVFSFLLWEATTAQALEALERLHAAMVDINDLRVSLPYEIVEILGPRYPRAEERALRLRATLNDLYKREHAVKFPELAGGKRDIRAYVESLEGMIVPFVGARVLLKCFAVHGVPVDESSRAALAAAGVCDESIDLHDLAGALARHVKADQAEDAHAAIQGLVDSAKPARSAAPTSKERAVAKNSKLAAKPAAKPASKSPPSKPAAKPASKKGRSGSGR